MIKYKKLGCAFLASVLKPNKVSARPIHIQLEPTTYCNLSCPHCPRDFYVEKPAHLSFENFKHIVDVIEPLNISLNGLGETFLNPEIFEMIAYAKEKKIDISTISNFVAISDESLEKIAVSGLNLLNVSLDASKKETYLQVRKRDAFEQIVTQIKKLKSLKTEGQKNFPLLRISFVIEQSNYKEMVDFYKMAKELKVDAVLFQIFNSFDKDKKDLISGMDADIIIANLKEVKKIEDEIGGPASNVDFLLTRINEILKIYDKQGPNAVSKCIMPWLSVYISVEGDVRYCCIYSAKRLSIGNIFSVNNFMDIYNSKEYQDFRSKLKKGIVPNPVCSDCIPESPFEVMKRSKWTPNFIFKK